MSTRQTAVVARDYLTLVARAYAAATGKAAPPAVRTAYVTLYKARVGVAVEAWFRRVTPTKFPELRVGVIFRFDDGRDNADAAGAFAARHAAALRELGYEPWPSETNNDRRFTTRLMIPLPGDDLRPLVSRAVDLARGYAALIDATSETDHFAGGGPRSATVLPSRASRTRRTLS